MATQQACPACGTPMREIVWGYETLADVGDAGDVVIGGLVVDVDPLGREAALQCPACGTRADASGTALERPAPAPVPELAVAFSSPLRSKEEVTMADRTNDARHVDTGHPDREHGADAHAYVDEDFGGIASGGDWRDHVEPYASREDVLPEGGAAARDRVEPYASREDALPERSAPSPDRVEPYASREDELPANGGTRSDRVDPYASREDALPERGDAGWRDRIEPFAGEPAERPVDEHATHTSDFTDAEEEGWPARDDD